MSSRPAPRNISQARRAVDLLILNIPSIDLPASPVEAPIAAALQVCGELLARLSVLDSTSGLAPENGKQNTCQQTT